MWEIINNLLADLSEAYVSSSSSLLTWGEEEMPECLKENSIKEEN